MIAKTVRITDLDPEGFAHINKVLSARDRGQKTLTVLHEKGQVVQAVHSIDGAVSRFRGPVHIPQTRAKELLRESGVDLVTVIDAGGLDDLSRRVVDLARECSSQGELLWRAREVWNNHPAIAMAPPPEPSRWPWLAAGLAAMADGSWIVARISRDDGTAFVLAARVDGGLVVEITSRPPASEPSMAVELTEAELDQLLLAPDPLPYLDRFLAR